MLLNRPVVDDQDVCDFTIRFSLRDQRGHFTFALGEPTEGFFGSTAWRERLLARNQRSGLMQEMIAERCVWDRSSQFLDQFLGSRKGILSLLVTLLDLIQLSEVEGDTPEQGS